MNWVINDKPNQSSRVSNARQPFNSIFNDSDFYQRHNKGFPKQNKNKWEKPIFCEGARASIAEDDFSFESFISSINDYKITIICKIIRIFFFLLFQNNRKLHVSRGVSTCSRIEPVICYYFLSYHSFYSSSLNKYIHIVTKSIMSKSV